MCSSYRLWLLSCQVLSSFHSWHAAWLSSREFAFPSHASIYPNTWSKYWTRRIYCIRNYWMLYSTTYDCQKYCNYWGPWHFLRYSAFSWKTYFLILSWWYLWCFHWNHDRILNCRHLFPGAHEVSPQHRGKERWAKTKSLCPSCYWSQSHSRFSISGSMKEILRYRYSQLYLYYYDIWLLGF